MNRRLAGVLAFAFVIAGGASYLLYVFLSQRLAQMEPQQEGANQVVVAARNLDIGTLLTENDVRLDDWQGSVPPNALTEVEKAAGRGVITPIYTGEPVVEERLAPEGAGAGLAATIPPGMRAVAVRVNDIVGVAGFIPPGSKVDLLIMGNPSNAPSSLGTLSKTLLQNVEVISAGQQIQRDNEGKPVQVPVVNLLATPEQAEIISLASSSASIQFILRNPLDKEETKTSGTAFNLLFTDNKSLPLPAPPRPAGSAQGRTQIPPPIVPAKPEPFTLEMIQGTQKSEFEFERSDEATER